MPAEVFWNPEKPGFDAAFTRRDAESAAERESLPEATSAFNPGCESELTPRQDSEEDHRQRERLGSSTDDRLLGVLAEALFDRDRARKALEALKAGPLYDPERRQWNTSGDELV